MPQSNDTVFSFLNVRPTRKYDANKLSGLLIIYDKTVSNDYWTDLVDAHTNDPSPSELKGEATSFSANNPSLLFSDVASFESSYNLVQQSANYIVENYKTLDKTPLQANIETTLGETLSVWRNSYTSAEYLKLWNTLFTFQILGTNEELVVKTIIVLRLINLFEILDEEVSSLRNSTYGLQSIYQAEVVLPSPIFPIGKNYSSSSAGTPQNEIDSNPNATLQVQIESYEKARKDLLFHFKLQQQRKIFEPALTQDEFCALMQYDNPYVAPTTRLDYTDCAADYQVYIKGKFTMNIDPINTYPNLEQETKNLITALGLTSISRLHLPFIVNCFNDMIADFTRQLKSIPKGERIVVIGGSLVSLRPFDVFNLNSSNPETDITTTLSALVRPIGTGDVNIVKEELVRYEAGEIAHIENILAKETKSRIHRNKREFETEIFSSTETTSTTETDTQTSERFELSNAASSVAQNSNSMTAGVQISADYGTVQASATAGYSSQNSQLQSSQTASNYAKDVTTKASEKVTQKVKESRRSLTRNEIEIINEHGVDNKEGVQHIIGMYQWVNKIYKAQVHNTGKRLMYEFMIPEPAAFFMYSQLNKGFEGSTIEKPTHPFKDENGNIQDFTVLSRGNYGRYAATYNVSSIQTPPQEFMTVSTAIDHDMVEGANYKTMKDLSVEIPSGYVGASVRINVLMSKGDHSYVTVAVANQNKIFFENGEHTVDLDSEIMTGIIPIGARTRDTNWVLTVVAECQLSDKAFDDWRIKTYDSILQSYERKLSEYEYQLSLATSDINIQGENPLKNRRIEEQELKKACIKLFTAQRFEDFDALRLVSTIQDGDKTYHYPDFDFVDSIQQGSFIRFFEQAFEWHNMTYHFYPYFWAQKSKWVSLMSIKDPDFKFEKFLTSGAARVIVPVRPEFTKAILHYQESGELWEGQDLPTLDDELFISIVDEIKEASVGGYSEPVGEPWEVTVPTNMVILNSSTTPELPNYE